MSPGSTQTVMQSPSSIERVMEWNKRKYEDEDIREAKRPRFYYFRLESESSLDSDNDTESIYSIQDKETDVARDTSDTDTKSETSGSELEVELEYDVASLSGDDEFPDNYSSSGTEDFQGAEGAIAAVLCDTSLEAWATDGETSDTGSVESVTITETGGRKKKDFWTCVQCNSQNDYPSYRYCEKCFQMRCWNCRSMKTFQCFPLCSNCYKVRKKFFPPRPRGNRKRKLVKKEEPKIKLDVFKSCLSSAISSQESALTNLSQDSGLGSSQDLPNWDFNQIVVPEHLKRKHRLSESNSECDLFDGEPPSKLRVVEKADGTVSNLTVVNLQSDLKSDSEHFDCNKSESLKSDSGISERSKLSSDLSDDKSSFTEKDLCIMCNTQPKNGIFLHGSIGHMCCCYKCAMRSWKSTKRCPICNCKVKNVVKLFTV